MKKVFVSFLILISGVAMFASCNLISSAGLYDKGLPTPDASEERSSANDQGIDHSGWDALLKKYVDQQGNVDYKGLKNEQAALNKYLELISAQNPSASWSTNELLAFYINLYNAYTVDLILRNYPVNSIKDIKAPWTSEFIKIGDKKISLAGIENSILRKMNEPRIHFAINCASISCPKLLAEAYTADKLEQQLEKVTLDFVNSDKNEITKSSVKLSSIFDWYRKDFFTGNRSLIDYLNQYSAIKIDKNASVTFLEYDWGLNER